MRVMAVSSPATLQVLETVRLRQRRRLHKPLWLCELQRRRSTTTLLRALCDNGKSCTRLCSPEASTSTYSIKAASPAQHTPTRAHNERKGAASNNDPNVSSLTHEKGQPMTHADGTMQGAYDGASATHTSKIKHFLEEEATYQEKTHPQPETSHVRTFKPTKSLRGRDTVVPSWPSLFGHLRRKLLLRCWNLSSKFWNAAMHNGPLLHHWRKLREAKVCHTAHREVFEAPKKIRVSRNAAQSVAASTWPTKVQARKKGREVFTHFNPLIASQMLLTIVEWKREAQQFWSSVKLASDVLLEGSVKPSSMLDSRLVYQRWYGLCMKHLREMAREEAWHLVSRLIWVLSAMFKFVEGQKEPIGEMAEKYSTEAIQFLTILCVCNDRFCEPKHASMPYGIGLLRKLSEDVILLLDEAREMDPPRFYPLGVFLELSGMETDCCKGGDNTVDALDQRVCNIPLSRHASSSLRHWSPFCIQGYFAPLLPFVQLIPRLKETPIEINSLRLVNVELSYATAKEWGCVPFNQTNPPFVQLFIGTLEMHGTSDPTIAFVSKGNPLLKYERHVAPQGRLELSRLLECSRTNRILSPGFVVPLSLNVAAALQSILPFLEEELLTV